MSRVLAGWWCWLESDYYFVEMISDVEKKNKSSDGRDSLTSNVCQKTGKRKVKGKKKRRDG